MYLVDIKNFVFVLCCINLSKIDGNEDSIKDIENIFNNESSQMSVDCIFGDVDVDVDGVYEQDEDYGDNMQDVVSRVIMWVVCCDCGVDEIIFVEYCVDFVREWF